MKYYFAYGSNLSLRQMNQRCPRSRLMGSGFISDYSLEFKTAFGNNAYATLEEKQGAQVPIAIYEIQTEDEQSLDRYEGVAGGHYYKAILTAQFNGEQINGLVYLMRKQPTHKVPHPDYIAIIREGYATHNFDFKIVNDAHDRASGE